MTNRTEELTAKAVALVKAQSTKALLDSLANLEQIAPEPADPQMREWCRMVDWVEEELLERLDCRDAHTDWVLSDAFGGYEGRTSYAFLAGVAK
ncbi:hypothetical protein [Microbacterium sp. cx-59]|uniref:hypothetical protein n=1 Tax=Microbacterium sp. cx-59 TaxID=2891207 RepID=UPI001E33693F|nr:hypothetical protein [Microbacterium sp. cx-59]MCC4906956.1 hypothetical protein [Microbacterium sp. cx-59]